MAEDPVRPLNIHASCVAIGGRGVLLRGPSGSGKSDLTLRLIDSYPDCRLVSDDRTDLTTRAGTLYARAPARIAGLLEVRGVGIVTLPFMAEAAIALLIDLVPRAAVPRLPASEPVKSGPQTGQSAELAGISLPRLALHAFDAATAAKIRLALSQF
ncbi:MAG TPA: aldolase [Alphaproteobacteria bacterium]|nr:aldolase [Alphaproteobacteria bacterium]